MERSPVPRRHINPETKSCCNIPFEIILFILSLMPYRNSLKFKCVCKAWYELISNDLAGLFLKRCRENSRGLVVCHNGGTKENSCLHISSLQTAGRGLKNLIIKPEIYVKNNKGYNPGFLILQSTINGVQSTINGVLCLSNDVYVYVCNPLTEEFVTLPAYNGQYSRLPLIADGLDGIGLGYCPSTREYKVVRIFNHLPDLPGTGVGELPRIPHKCAVITVGSPSNSSSRLWRDMEYPFPIALSFRESVCVDGIIYFATRNIGDEIDSFDVRKEEFKPLVGPPVDPGYFTRKLAQHRGSLCVIHSYLNKRMDFWMMVPDDNDPDLVGGSWDRVYQIPYYDFLPYRDIDCDVVDFSWLDKGKLLITPFVTNDDGWVLYDMKSRRLQEAIDFGAVDLGVENWLSHKIVSGFQESLAAIVPVQSGNINC